MQDVLDRFAGIQMLERLVHDGYSLAFGARFLKRMIDSRLKLPISQQWNSGRHFTAVVGDEGLEIVSDMAATA